MADKKTAQPSFASRMAQSTSTRVKAELAAAKTTWKTTGRYGNVISAGVAARQGYAKAQDQGKTGIDAAKVVANEAALPLAVIAAPVAAKGLSAGASSMFAKAADHLAKRASRRLPTAARTKVEAAAANAALRAKVVGSALQAASFGAKLVRPAVLGIAAYQGAKRDNENYKTMVRGAFRGALSSFDPSAIVLEKGAVETLFDKGFGAPSGKAAEIRKVRLEGGPTRKANPSIHADAAPGMGRSNTETEPARDERGRFRSKSG